jgi:prepilin-type N-terminal cleavage/methylation domain-containing protein
MKHYLPAERRGFTLIELLVVIGILAVLLAITLIAINPARQFSQANNTKRSSDVNAILNAIDQYAADNKGALPGTIPVTAAVIGSGTGEVDICTALVTQYLAALPVDPLTNNGAPISDCAQTGGYTTNYTVLRSAQDNRITVSAPATELGITPISVTR